MKKRLLLLLGLMLTAWSAAWANNVAEGKLKNGRWEIDRSGNLNIYVSGDMSNFKEGTAPWYPYSNDILRIQTDATSIGDYAFCGLERVWDVDAPSAVKVGKFAFKGCGGDNPNTLYLPKVKTVDDWGFASCCFDKLSLPIVKSIGNYAFSDDAYISRLSFIDLGNQIASIGKEPFYRCGSMQNTGWEFTHGLYLSAPNPPVIEGAGTSSDVLPVEMHVPENLLDTYWNKFYSSGQSKWKDYLSAGALVYDDKHQVISVWCLAAPEWQEYSHKNSLCVEYFNGIPSSHANMQAPWYSKVSLSDSRRLVIFGEYRSIPEKLLANNTDVKEVYLWSTYPEVSVGDGAFSGCTSLTTVGEVSRINVRSNAFNGCTALASLPKISGPIGARAFYGCSKLNTIDIAEASSIGESAFERCTSMTQMKAPKATEIGNRAFHSTRVVDIRMGTDIKTIGNEAFAGRPTAASVLTTNIYMESQQPPSVGNNTFQGFSKAKTILHTEYSSNYTTSPWNGFTLSSDCYPITGDGWKLTQDGILIITKNVADKSSASIAQQQNPWMPYLDEVNTILIENGVTEIGDYAFYRDASATSRLATVSVPVSLWRIGAHAFQNHNKMQTIFVDNVKKMGDEALAGCTSLTRIVFGSQTEKLGNSVLANTPEMEVFEINTVTPPEVTESTFDNMGQDYEPDAEAKPEYAKGKAKDYAFARRRSVRAKVPEQSFNEYVTTPGWDRLLYTDKENGDILIAADMKDLNTGEKYGKFVIYGNGLLDISVTNDAIIADYAWTSGKYWGGFADRITTLNVHEGPTRIAAVFNNLKNLKTVTLPESVKHLAGTFAGCTSLESVDFPNIETLEEAKPSTGAEIVGPFTGCTSLTSVTLPALQKMESRTFEGCTKLTEFKAPVTDMGISSFKNRASLEELDLSSLSIIPRTCFEGCSKLKTVTINGLVYTEAFKGCTALETVYFGNHVPCLADNIFSGTALKAIYCATPTPPTKTTQSKQGLIFGGIDPSQVTCYVPADYLKMYKQDSRWGQLNIVADESYEEALFPTGALIGDNGIWTLDEEGTLIFEMWDEMPNTSLSDIAIYSPYINRVAIVEDCSFTKGVLMPMSWNVNGNYEVSRTADYPNATELNIGEGVTEICNNAMYLPALKNVYSFATVPPVLGHTKWYWAFGAYDAENNPAIKNNATLHVLKTEGVLDAYKACADTWGLFPNIVADLDEGGVIDAISSPIDFRHEPWYTIDGQKLSGLPKKAGIYVVGGKKVLIK